MRKDIQLLFEMFCGFAGLPISSEYIKGQGYLNNFFKLDYNSVYGGYTIVEVLKTTGEADFDGLPRMSNKEMSIYLEGLIKGYTMAK